MSKRSRQATQKAEASLGGQGNLAVDAHVIRVGKTKQRPGRKSARVEFVQDVLWDMVKDGTLKDEDKGTSERHVQEVNDRLARHPACCERYPNKKVEVSHTMVARALRKVREANSR